jgi:hypothetical protein
MISWPCALQCQSQAAIARSDRAARRALGHEVSALRSKGWTEFTGPDDIQWQYG